jgi:hypothetical protein
VRERWARIWPSLLAVVTLTAVGGPAAVASYRHARDVIAEHGDPVMAPDSHSPPTECTSPHSSSSGSAATAARQIRTLGRLLGRHDRNHRREPRRRTPNPNSVHS